MAYCHRCDRYFNSEHALQQHEENSSRHNMCYDCDRDFATGDGLIQHWVQSTLHHYCQDCDLHFDDDDELEDHFEEDHWYCSFCNRIFASEHGLHEHNRQKHWYCESCRRVFQNENNLDNHLRSSIHQPRRIRCPGQGCNAAFVSEAALVRHCEEGSCPSGVTRKAVNKVVASIDRGNIITNPARMIESSSSVVTQTWATDLSWNGEAYECFICHREFRLLSALNMHLQSAAHESKLYQCPPAWNGCSVEFKTLSGLMQHFESGCCGVERFKRRFENVIDKMTRRAGMITF